MEALDALGINGKLLLAQIVNFLILLLLLKKFLYGPVVKMLGERKETISQGIKDSEQAAKSLSQAEEKAEKVLEKAYAEANTILVEAKKESKGEAEEILKKANEQAAMIRKNALEEADAAKGKALGEAKSELGNIVTLALNKIVGKEISENDKEKLAQKAIREL